ncbi:MAG: hypothetical protein WD426_11490 [Anditalea sp.]
MNSTVGIFLLLFCLSRTESFGQQAAGSFLVSGAMDLAKTDAPGLIRRFQLGSELNYFYLHSLSFSGGYEFNYNRPNHVTLGSRFYPLEPVFIRFRGLVGNKSDIAVGAGYTYNISYRFRLEGMVDYYAISQVAGLRVGIGFLIN